MPRSRTFQGHSRNWPSWSGTSRCGRLPFKTSYDKLVEARAVDGLNHEKPSSFSLYQAATPPDPADPARPLPLLYMLIGVVVGVLGALVTLFLSYRMFKRLPNAETGSDPA